MKRVTICTCNWLGTMSYGSGAGFYMDERGPLPFAFGTTYNEDYLMGWVVSKGFSLDRRPPRLPPPKSKRIARTP
jgi:hypothetical protein